MLTRIALAVALVVGAAAVAQASSSENENGGTGGYHIGPYGQWLGGPAFRFWGHHYRGAYAYEPRYRRHWRYER
jgi:hypothetical protein